MNRCTTCCRLAYPKLSATHLGSWEDNKIANTGAAFPGKSARGSTVCEPSTKGVAGSGWRVWPWAVQREEAGETLVVKKCTNKSGVGVQKCS